MAAPFFLSQATIAKKRLLRRGLWLRLGLRLLLLAHALQLLVDLLRCFDSIGGFGLGGVGRRGSGGGASARRRVDLVGRPRGLGYGLRDLDGRSLSRLRSVVEDRRAGTGGRGSALTWGKDEFCGRVAVAMHENHVAAGAVE